MMLREELVERMATAICEVSNDLNPYYLEPGDELGIDGYNNKEEPCHYYWREYTEKATAALQALLESLPDDSKDIETQARNMQLQCIRDNPSAGAVPTIYHYEQQLQHLNKNAEYYKQLLNMRK